MALGMVIFGMSALYVIQYVRYQKSPEYRMAENTKNAGGALAEDPYGGNTPEETLILFIDALKLGNINLATKYFVPEKQNEWNEDLAKIKEKGLLQELIKSLAAAKKASVKEARASFFFQDETGTLVILEMTKLKRWKIVGF